MTSLKKIKFGIISAIGAIGIVSGSAFAQPEGAIVIKVGPNGKGIIRNNRNVGNVRLRINGKNVVIDNKIDNFNPAPPANYANNTGSKTFSSYLKREEQISHFRVGRLCNQLLFPKTAGFIIDTSKKNYELTKTIIRLCNLNDPESVKNTKIELEKLGKNALPQIFLSRHQTKNPKLYQFLTSIIQDYRIQQCKNLDKILKKLGSRKYKVRAEGSKELITLGEAAIPLIKDAIKHEKNPEIAQRANVAIQQIKQNRYKKAIQLIFHYNAYANSALQLVRQSVDNIYHGAQSEYNRVRFGQLRNKLTADMVAYINKKYKDANVVRFNFHKLLRDFKTFSDKQFKARSAIWEQYQEEKKQKAKQSGETEVNDFGVSFSDDTTMDRNYDIRRRPYRNGIRLLGAQPNIPPQVLNRIRQAARQGKPIKIQIPAPNVPAPVNVKNMPIIINKKQVKIISPAIPKAQAPNNVKK